jgi:GWxTD domain-containing protein
LAAAPAVPADQPAADKGPGDKYREWLEITEYIILPQEKDVFLQLETDRDRDVFIRAFWRQRDPTPGTPQNEYREEHMARFLYANSRLKRATPREGWMTDMGRIHIVLGPPHSIERFDSKAGLHPCQVWYYYGDKRRGGLPTYFALLFYQRNGSGEYVLYNPAGDGPHSLLVDNRGIDIHDHERAYTKIRELAPTLADVSISLIPGERPLNFIPSARNNILLSDIFESPRKDVVPSYATHFLDYKGVVSTEYLTNYVESASEVAVVFDPLTQSHFVHFSINPQEISIDYYEPGDQYFCNFKLNVTLRGREDDRLVYQYAKDFPFYFESGDMERIRGNGIAIQDSFPVIRGDYRLDILIQNSVGKEFSVSEKNISVPKGAGPAKITGPVLGFELKESPGLRHAPFKLANARMEVDPGRTFAVTEQVVIFFNLHNVTRELWKNGRVRIRIAGLQEQKGDAARTIELPLTDYPYNEALGITHSIPAGEFEPDYYEVILTLVNGSRSVIDEESGRFIISPKEIVPHPVTLSKTFPSSKSYLFYYSLAYQYDHADDPAKAEAAYEKALQMKPDFKEGMVEYAHFLLRQNKSRKALEKIEQLADDAFLKFEYHLVRGLAHMQAGRFAQAVLDLEAGNAVYDSDVRLLNALGYCYSKTGSRDKAQASLEASLRLNPDQDRIRRLLSEIEKLQDKEDGSDKS